MANISKAGSSKKTGLESKAKTSPAFSPISHALITPVLSETWLFQVSYVRLC